MMIRYRTGICKATAGLIALLAGDPAGAASAQETGPYAGIGVAFASSNANRIENVARNSGHIQLRGGYGLNKFLAVEADASFAVVKSDFDAAGVSAPPGRVILNRSFAGFLVARYPLTDQVSVFARGGYHRSRIMIQSAGVDQAASFDNAAFGGGAVYRWGRHAIRADYTVLKTNINNNDLNHRIFGLSYVRQF